MEFPNGQPELIRAINQRWLINFWKRCLGSEVAPLWRTVEAENLSRISANLSFLDVAGAGDGERYLIRFNGPTIARVYGKIDCSGKFLDEVIPPEHYQTARSPYRRTVATGCPVYTIHDVRDSGGRVVHYERLLLPFSIDGKCVDRILASFEFVCVDGAFDSNQLLKTQTTRPVLRLSATIEREAMA
ncbi:MAG TPA: PAS domain-containing protein [Pseudolabrys sp.]|nr:PAS domain-containing protein [Pseudolabrys sp.]